MTAPALAFDTDNGRHYRHPGNAKEVPSITNVKGLKHIDLKNFAAKKCANYAADRREILSTLDRDEAFRLVRGAVWAKEENSPSEIGDIVHKWIEVYIQHGLHPEKAEPIEVRERVVEWSTSVITARNMFKSFLAFEAKYQPEYTHSEFTVWSDKHDYAGTGDVGMNIGNVGILGDFKTGAAVYPDVAMQLAALQEADYIINEDGSERPIPRFDRYAVLHLRPRSATLVPVYHTDEWFKAFLGLRELFRVNVEFGEKTLGFAPQIKHPQSTSNR